MKSETEPAAHPPLARFLWSTATYKDGVPVLLQQLLIPGTEADPKYGLLEVVPRDFTDPLFDEAAGIWQAKQQRFKVIYSAMMDAAVSYAKRDRSDPIAKQFFGALFAAGVSLDDDDEEAG